MFARPDDWGPSDYAKWLRRWEVFYSERGAKINLIIISSELEVALMNMHMKYGDTVVSVDKNANIRLLGIPVRFTKNLPYQIAWCVSSYQKEAA